MHLWAQFMEIIVMSVQAIVKVNFRRGILGVIMGMALEYSQTQVIYVHLTFNSYFFHAKGAFFSSLNINWIFEIVGNFHSKFIIPNPFFFKKKEPHTFN